MAMLRRVSAESTGAENFMLLLVIAILPGIAEEVLFRGFVQRGFERSYGPWRCLRYVCLVSVDLLYLLLSRSFVELYREFLAAFTSSIREAIIAYTRQSTQTECKGRSTETA